MEPKKVKIIIKKRIDDYMAYIEDEPGCWDCGPSPNNAIGELVRTWPEKFNIILESWQQKD